MTKSQQPAAKPPHSEAPHDEAPHDPEARLKALGLTLPTLGSPTASYLRYRRAGDLAFLSGQGPTLPDGSTPKGKVGRDVSAKEAAAHARLVGLGLLAVMKEAAGGDLTKIEVVKLLGMVNAAKDFEDHPKVINGCSDLLVEVLGERGRHARSAVGFSSLPGGMTVEIEAIVRVLA